MSQDTATIKHHLQRMDDEAFEYFVADLWEQEGWSTSVSQQSRDKSLDVMAEQSNPYHQRHAIQAKRYQADNRVGGPKISEYASLTDQFDADAAVVVTTSGFTKDARERADTLGVKLVDGDTLAQMVRDNDATDLLAKHGQPVQSSDAPATAPGGGQGHQPAQGQVRSDDRIETSLPRPLVKELVNGDVELNPLNLQVAAVGLAVQTLSFLVYYSDGGETAATFVFLGGLLAAIAVAGDAKESNLLKWYEDKMNYILVGLLIPAASVIAAWYYIQMRSELGEVAQAVLPEDRIN